MEWEWCSHCKLDSNRQKETIDWLLLLGTPSTTVRRTSLRSRHLPWQSTVRLATARAPLRHRHLHQRAEHRVPCRLLPYLLASLEPSSFSCFECVLLPPFLHSFVSVDDQRTNSHDLDINYFILTSWRPSLNDVQLLVFIFLHLFILVFGYWAIM